MARAVGRNRNNNSNSNNSILNFLIVVAAVVVTVENWNTINESSSSSFPAVVLVEAFAASGGGFGGGGGGFGSGAKTKTKTSNKNKNNNNNNNKKAKKRQNLAEMTTTTTTDNNNNNNNNNNKNDNKNESLHTSSTAAPEQPKLDKWGLPIATLEDIFPPPLPGTKLDPVDSSKDHYTLSEIQECLKDHVDLGDLTRFFDDQGFAKIPNDDDGGTTMRLRLLHRSPPVLTLDHFLTADECRDIRAVAETETETKTKTKTTTATTHRVDSATFRGALSTRTSTSWFCRYVDLPVLLAKAHHILGVPLETMEEPQLVRYRGGEEFSWHYDEIPSSQLSNGGQRLATLLVYLTDVPSSKGGGTTFRDLKESSSSSSPLVMQPQMGSALLFFPSFADGSPDDRTLHKSEVLLGDHHDNNKNDKDNDNDNDNEDDNKWIVQMWTHQREYQAALPIGNSNEAARDAMEEIGARLGYNDVNANANSTAHR